MAQGLMDSIRKTVEKKSTEELKRIYTEHNESRWSSEAFEVIRQILMERGEKVAPQPSTPLLPSPSGKIAGGIVWALVGLFVYLWAS